MIPSLLLAASMLFALSARGEPAHLTHEELQAIGAEVGIDVDPDAGLGEYLRVPDDSDPEMRALAFRFLEVTPCGDHITGLCEDALNLMRGGGDRLASYLIRQYEASLAEGYPNRGTYLRLIGYTESGVAYRYLARLVDEREAGFRGSNDAYYDFLYAIEALGQTRDRQVAERALRLLETHSNDDDDVRVRAVNALDRVQSKHGPIPGAAARLHAVRSKIPPAAPAAPQDDVATLARRIDQVLANPGSTRP